MMRKLFLLFFSLIVSMALTAANVTKENAELIAKQFLGKQRPTARTRTVKMARQQPLPLSIAADASAFYVFNVDGDEGYVIVSGSTLSPQILGYARQGSFHSESVPPHMQAWLDSYAEQIAYLEQTQGRYEAPRLVQQHDAIAPLLTSKWNQGQPYNNLCPIAPGTSERTVTGCVATALAQVINYYKYPAKTIAPIPSYTTYSLNIDMPEIGITAIDWDNMLNSYSGSSTSAQQKAVAQLMLLCGQAVEMNFNTSSAGGSDADARLDLQALLRYFGYDETVRYMKRYSFSAAAWDELIYNELKAGRPVIYNGQSVGGGHSFIVDGYDGNGLFHINWGWGGADDDYFLLSVLNPYDNSSIGASSSNDGFSFSQSAVVGIQHSSGEVTPALFSCLGIGIDGETTFTRTSSSKDFTGISVWAATYNTTSYTNTFFVNFALADENDELLALLGDGAQLNDVPYNYGIVHSENNCTFGAGLSDGTYYIIPGGASEYSTEWEPCWGSNVYRIKAVIKDNQLTLSEPSVSLSGTIEQPQNAFVGQKLELTAQITNNGSNFNDDIFLTVDGKDMGGRHFEAREGETASFTIDFIPTTTGEKTVTLSYYDSQTGADVPFATLKVNVVPDQSTVALSYHLTVDNAVDYVVNDDHAKVSVSITNNGDAYNNSIAVLLYKYDPSDGYYHSVAYKTARLTLAAGASTVRNFTFDGLEDQQEYLVAFWYTKDDAWQDDQIYASFTVSIPQEQLLLGDVNGDGALDVFDIVALANAIIGTPSESFNWAAADLNGDGNADVYDIVRLANIIINAAE